ncbi:MAG: DUF1828 domain-containing protein [Acidimicrobiia bacterium]|nr:DUF1828 domain-containing protein [bacterium]MXW69589.1 DUF1828 domain-containing protein [Acidimicrobiia bacterium]MXY73648.1 DUF1828 domain-containing protein [Acidimicrobiia bacterium]MYD41662.1 DUF1828 domain-containing protein [Acidimicrobiia bacterium]
MISDLDTLRRLLCERLCHEVGIERRPDGVLMLRTHFRFPDGDGYPIYLSELSGGGLRLSDRGHTLMHISYEHDIDSFMDGTRGMLMERIMNETGLSWEDGAFCLDTTPERLSEAVFGLGQALTRLFDLTMLSRTNVGSTFYDDLADLLTSLVDEAKIQRDYLPEIPNAQAYPVDYRIEGKGMPLFVYGIPNRDKARLATIMLSYFHRHTLKFESILVFANQSEIPRMDLARLSDVGGEMISSLASHEDFTRKIIRRVAA